MQVTQLVPQTHVYSLSQFLFQLTLKQSDSKPFIIIQLTHHTSRQRYSLQINQQTIDSIQGLSKFYENPAELYQQLLLIINDIKVDGNARITFEVMIGKSKTRKITLETTKVEQKEQNLFDLKSINEEINLLKKKLQEQTRKMKSENIQLTKKLREMQNIDQWKDSQRNRQTQMLKKQLLELKQAFDKKNSQNMHLGEAVAALTLNVKDLKANNQELKANLQTFNSYLQAIRQRLHETNSRLDSVQQELSNEEQSSQQQQQAPTTHIIRVSGFKQHKNNSLFDITKINNVRFRLSILQSGNEYNSFIHTYRAFPGKITVIKVCVAFSLANQIYLGVCTSNLLNCTNFINSKESLALSFKNSAIMYNSQTMVEGQYRINAQQIITMEVDLSKYKISWIKHEGDDETTLNQLDTLPLQFRNKPLFLHISMIRTQDAVDIITV